LEHIYNGSPIAKADIQENGVEKQDNKNDVKHVEDDKKLTKQAKKKSKERSKSKGKTREG